MKKLLLVALTAVTCLGLAGCQGGKKLSAEEAKTELMAIAENTEKNTEKLASFKTKQTFNASIKAKDIKSKTGSQTMNLGKGSVTAKYESSFNGSVNTEQKKAKVDANLNASLNADVESALLPLITGEEGTSKKYNLSAKGKMDGYYVNTEEKYFGFTFNSANLYGNFEGEINKELADLLGSTETNFKAAKNLYSYESLFDLIINDEDEEDEEYEEEAFDFSFIKDWTIFTKSGNTLTADCSNLAAFDIEGISDYQMMLKNYGLELKVSKLQIEVSKENVITGFDFAMSLKGSIDLSKIDLSDMYMAVIDEEAATTYSGTITVDLSLGFGLDLTYGAQEAINVPEELTKVEEEDMDDYLDFDFEDIFEYIDDIMSGTDRNAKAAVRKGDSLMSCIKTLSLEAAAYSSGNPTIIVDYGTTKTSTPTLTVLDGDTDVTSTRGFTPYDVMVDGLQATGKITATLDYNTYKFTYTVDGLNIDGYTITVDSYGYCEATK